MTVPVTEELPTLKEGQWRIGDLTFGSGTQFPIATFPDISYGSADTQDQDRSQEDGIFFGKDRYGANIFTFDMAVWAKDLKFNLQWLTKWWKGNRELRRTPGKAIPLKYCFEGQQKQVFGRPRNFDPIPGPPGREWIRIQCDFYAIDDKFYSQEEFRAHVGINPSSIGGLFSPLIAPLETTGTSSSTAGEFTSDGNVEAWVRAVIQGPITAPSFELIDNVDSWKQTMPGVDLNFDQQIIVSSYPWDRKVIDERGASRAGAFDQASRKLSELWLPPGDHELVLRGTDPTSTSYIDLYWYEASLNI